MNPGLYLGLQGFDMRVLGLESSGPRGGVALIEDGRVLGEIVFEKGMVHGRDIAPSADRLLRDAGWRPADLDLIAVDIGPGSYTGLRVGLAAAKGLALALGKPLLGVPSLDALVQTAVSQDGPIAAVLSAKWDQVYGALYEVRKGIAVRTTDMFAEKPEQFAARLSTGTRVVGDALERHAELFSSKGARPAPPETWAPKPAIVAELGRRRFAEGLRHDAGTIVPLYLAPIEFKKAT
jgi:tRNA threonylcarbamoyladenosine biosynthesis protein TsaB